MKQVFLGGCGGLGTAGPFTFLDGFALTSSTRQGRENLILEAGTLSNLRVVITVAPGGAVTRTYTVWVNGVATALTCSIGPAATSAEDITHTVAVAAGDLITLKHTAAVGAAAANGVFSAVFEATTANRAVWGSQATGAPVLGGPAYGALGSTAENAFPSATAAGAAVPWAINCTITSFSIRIGPAPGAGKTRTFTIFRNGVAEASSALVFGAADTVLTVVGLSISVSPQDELCVESKSTGGPPAAAFSVGVSYAPSVDGQWNISGDYRADYAGGRYAPLNGQTGENVTENTRQVLAFPASAYLGPWFLSGLYVKTNTAPGGANTRTYTLRRNAANSALEVTLSGAATSGSIAGLIEMQAGDVLDMLQAKSAGAAASARQRWCFGALAPAARQRTMTGVGL